MNIRLIVSSLVLVGLIAFFPFSVASADGPVVEGPFHEEGTAVLVDCGAFQVLDVYEVNFTVKRFFDEEGNLVKIVEQVWGTDTFTNSVTGKAYPMDFHNNTIVDFSTTPPQAANMGVLYRLIVPGAGAVFLDVGRIVLDRQGNVYFQAGPHQLFDSDFEALCAALE
ncbi:MAG TPA: hypothetical protein VF918_01360 [Anaerolineales bacterium]